MRLRRWDIPLRASALLACVAASSTCVGTRTSAEPQSPAVPSVGAIPVLPMPEEAPSARPDLAHASLEPSATEAPTALSPSPATPADEPASEPPSAPVPAVDAPGGDPPSPRVVLVDEPPYRSAHAQTRERADRPHGARHHGHGQRPYHPAPGIVIDVTDAAGGSRAADLERQARSAGYWPVRHCYEEGLRRDPRQTLSGKVSLDLDVTAGGAVERAAIDSATLRDEAVVLCVAREAAHLAFGTGVAPGTARMDVTLSVGDEPVPTPRPVPHADELREALRASWPAVQQCYASRLGAHPDAGGDLELRFRARSNGEILEVAEQGDTRFADVDVTRCVLGVYRTARLPAARVCTSRETTFAYAMHLEAKR